MPRTPADRLASHGSSWAASASRWEGSSAGQQCCHPPKCQRSQRSGSGSSHSRAAKRSGRRSRRRRAAASDAGSAPGRAGLPGGATVANTPMTSSAPSREASGDQRGRPRVARTTLVTWGSAIPPSSSQANSRRPAGVGSRRARAVAAGSGARGRRSRACCRSCSQGSQPAAAACSSLATSSPGSSWPLPVVGVATSSDGEESCPSPTAISCNRYSKASRGPGAASQAPRQRRSLAPQTAFMNPRSRRRLAVGATAARTAQLSCWYSFRKVTAGAGSVGSQDWMR
jgi:hypothetical protein